MNENSSNNKVAIKSISPEKVESSIKAFVKYFLFGGVLLIGFSLLHLVSLFQDGYTPFKLYSTIINFIYGIGIIICASLLKKRNVAILYLFGSMVAVNFVTSILFGSWLNIIPMIVEICILIYFYMLKSQGAIR